MLTEEGYDNEEFIILFGPRNGKMLKQSHPELNTYKEFKDLPNDEYFFVWLFSSQSSSIPPDMADGMRASIASKKAFKSDLDKQKKYISLDFPEKVKEAIEKMKTFSPEARYVAKRTVQDIFHNIQKMTRVEMSDFEETEIVDGIPTKKINWSGKKQYVDMAAKTSELLPELIVQIEQGFGVDTKTGKELNEEKTIDTYHKLKKDNII